MPLRVAVEDLLHYHDDKAQTILGHLALTNLGGCLLVALPAGVIADRLGMIPCVTFATLLQGSILLSIPFVTSELGYNLMLPFSGNKGTRSCHTRSGRIRRSSPEATHTREHAPPTLSHPHARPLSCSGVAEQVYGVVDYALIVAAMPHADSLARDTGIFNAIGAVGPLLASTYAHNFHRPSFDLNLSVVTSNADVALVVSGTMVGSSLQSEACLAPADRVSARRTRVTRTSRASAPSRCSSSFRLRLSVARGGSWRAHASMVCWPTRRRGPPPARASVREENMKLTSPDRSG